VNLDDLERSARAASVPLTEQLLSVPQDAVLKIDTPNALGCMDTRSIPVGRLCHEAAAALRASLGDSQQLAEKAAPNRPKKQIDARWRRLDELHEMARQFTCHPLSRGISDCENAGDLMNDAATEIERLCRVRNCLAGSAKTRAARLHQLERQRDFLLGELRRIDNDPGNSGHLASEAIAAICAEEGSMRNSCEESAQSLRDIECTCSAADMPFGRCCKAAPMSPATKEKAALLALGLLWMTERQSDKVQLAYTTLRDALGGKEALRQGIQAAINAGLEADHPADADYWAGKKEE
jgi:hypothetical protein